MNKMKKPDKQIEQVSGIFWKSLYRSSNGTRCVYQYSSEGSIITVVGENLPNACLQATFTGEWRTTKQGRQFFADMAVCTLPDSAAKIADYISGLKVGISHNQALLMVKSCGEATFWSELLSDPLQFCSVPGVISEALTALHIYAGEVSTQHELFSFFGTDLPCNGSRYKRICDYFDRDLEKVVSSIKNNPFVLMNCGYTFRELDQFCAKRTIFPLNDYRRMIAAALQVLRNAKSEAHVGLPHEAILDKISFLLREQGAVATQDIAVFLASAEQAGDLIYSGSLYYLPRSFSEESTIADGVLRLLVQPDDTVDDAAFEDAMARYEAKKGFSLSPDQRKAVRTALEKKLLVITGGPGTGKSTILDAILTCWKEFHDSDWLLMAPTGKAAVRMTETTGQPATTIHSALSLNVDNDSVNRMDCIDGEISASLIVLDECSMIDQTVMASLVSALRSDSSSIQHLVLVGDPEQLPSVGWGNVLADLISSEVVPVCRLNTIYRQGAGNPIITNSGKMQSGDINLEWSEDFVRYHVGDDDANKHCACQLYQLCVRSHGIENVAMLSPYHHSTAISTDALNTELQQLMNPDCGQGQISAKGKLFRNGARVMQLRNANGLSNGDIGTIVWVDSNARETDACLGVRFDGGREVTYIRDELSYLELAYAISIHKSQGSQYKAIIIVLPNRTSSFLKRNILYTAVTRSSQYVIIVSPTPTISYCIENAGDSERYTMLSARLCDGMDQYAIQMEMENNYDDFVDPFSPSDESPFPELDEIDLFGDIEP